MPKSATLPILHALKAIVDRFGFPYLDVKTPVCATLTSVDNEVHIGMVTATLVKEHQDMANEYLMLPLSCSVQGHKPVGDVEKEIRENMFV